MVQMTNRGRSRTAFPQEGDCCKGSNQSGAPAPRFALAWTGRCLRVDVSPWRTKKMHFWNSIRVIWYIYLLAKRIFKVNYWIHYHVCRSSHFSCFDAFVRTLIYLWKFKERVSEGKFPLISFWGGVPPSEVEKIANFQTQLGAYLLPTFYWKPLFIFNKILAIYTSIPPTFLVSMPLLGIINFWPLKKWRCLWLSEGNFPSEAEEMQFLNSIYKLWCISFANILLKIHYSFLMKYWLLLSLIPPTFPFFFYDIGYYHVYSSYVSCFNAFAELL